MSKATAVKIKEKKTKSSSLLLQLNRILLEQSEKVDDDPAEDTDDDEEKLTNSESNSTANEPSPLCATQCIISCNSKWHNIHSCFKTKWGCFQGCDRACKGDATCPNKCMAQLDWERCTREACKLGCFLGSSVEARFPLATEDGPNDPIIDDPIPGPTPNGPSPSPNDDPSPGPTPNDPEPTPGPTPSGPTPSGPTPSPGPRSCTEDGIVCMKDDQKQVKECILNQGNIKQVRPPNPNSKSRQIQCCGVEECMEEYNTPTPGPTPSNGPSTSNGPTPSDEPTPSNGPSPGPSEDPDPSGASGGEDPDPSGASGGEDTGPSGASGGEDTGPSGASGGEDTGPSGNTGPSGGEDEKCEPECLMQHAKTLYECFQDDYPLYQEKISKMFNLPNTKTAEANTDLLNAWKKCSESPSTYCEGLEPGDMEENCKKWEAQQNEEKHKQEKRIRNSQLIASSEEQKKKSDGQYQALRINKKI